jgi:hypothetical protein
MYARRSVPLALGVALLVALPLLAAGTVIPDTEAAKHVGETVSVKGVVASVAVGRGDTTYVNFGKPYPNQTFSAVIYKEARSRFADPAKWKGKTITVTGTVKLNSRKMPHIVLENPSQVSEPPEGK